MVPALPRILISGGALAATSFKCGILGYVYIHVVAMELSGNSKAYGGLMVMKGVLELNRN